MRVVCISGKAQNGKDTTAGFLKEVLEERGNRVLIIHYADLLKYLCRTYFGWNGNKDEEGRRILQYVGTDIIRNREPDYWVQFVAGFLSLFDTEWDYILIPDTRFPNEVDHMKELGFEVVHLRIVRTDFESPLTEEQQKHPSETALDDVFPDLTILNNAGLEQLKESVEELVDNGTIDTLISLQAPFHTGVRLRK